MENTSFISKENYESSDYWGIHVVINLKGCDHSKITDETKIKEYVIKLTEVIGMKRYGETLLERFGEKPLLYGYSMFQFIETSSITAHFDEVGDRAFIDIFSCSYYDQEKAIKFTAEFFKAKGYEYKVLMRK